MASVRASAGARSVPSSFHRPESREPVTHSYDPAHPVCWVGISRSLFAVRGSTCCSASTVRRESAHDARPSGEEAVSSSAIMPRPDNGGLTGARSGPLTGRVSRKIIIVVLFDVVLDVLGAHGRFLDLIPLLVPDRSPGNGGYPDRVTSTVSRSSYRGPVGMCRSCAPRLRSTQFTEPIGIA